VSELQVWEACIYVLVEQGNLCHVVVRRGESLPEGRF